MLRAHTLAYSSLRIVYRRFHGWLVKVEISKLATQTSTEGIVSKLSIILIMHEWYNSIVFFHFCYMHVLRKLLLLLFFFFLSKWIFYFYFQLAIPIRVVFLKHSNICKSFNLTIQIMIILRSCITYFVN